MSATPGPPHHVVGHPGRFLERMIDAEHRVHMTGKQQLDRRLRADLQVQVAPVRDGKQAAVGRHRLDGRRVLQVRSPGSVP